MIDQAKVVIRAGKGGDGVVHFHRAKFLPKGGPDGGDGGRGGSVYMVTDPNLASLDHFAFRQKFEAENGRPGGDSKSSGAAGEDLYLKVPVGTLLRLTATEGQAMTKEIDFDKEGMEVLIAKAGNGGKGNWHFKSSTNTTPRQATVGTPGEEWQVEMSLKLLADIGLVGLPNVGKSSLLSVLTKARPKIAEYPFTTLEPNLGVLRLAQDKSVIMADIPGLIEGASQGKGLGVRFLQHIERTRGLVHVLALAAGEIDLTADEVVSRLVGDYRLVRQELASCGQVEKKKEVVVLNKIDLVPEELVKEVVEKLAKKGIKARPVSVATLAGMDQLKRELMGLV